MLTLPEIVADVKWVGMGHFYMVMSCVYKYIYIRNKRNNIHNIVNMTISCFIFNVEVYRGVLKNIFFFGCFHELSILRGEEDKRME